MGLCLSPGSSGAHTGLFVAYSALLSLWELSGGGNVSHVSSAVWFFWNDCFVFPWLKGEPLRKRKLAAWGWVCEHQQEGDCEQRVMVGLWDKCISFFGFKKNRAI